MFEGAVWTVLERLLGTYLDIKEMKNSDNLKMNLWNGEFTLKNVEVKTTALQDFDLPIDIMRATVGTLKVKLPWKNLESQPTSVYAENIFVVLKLKKEATRRKKLTEAQFARLKQDQLDFYELKNKSTQNAKESKKKGEDDGELGWLGRKVDAIVDNLSVQIKDVHIRIEDDVSDNDHFSFGVTLERLEMQSSDSEWNVLKDGGGTNPAAFFKLMEMQCLTVYWNPGGELFCPKAAEVEKDQLVASLKDSIPRLVVSDKKSDLPVGQAVTVSHSWILRPLNASCRLKWNKLYNVKDVTSGPEAECDLVVSEIALEMDQRQYHNLLRMLETMTYYYRRNRLKDLRPIFRPLEKSGNPDKHRQVIAEWWQFGARASRPFARWPGWDPKVMAERIADRKVYSKLYWKQRTGGMIFGKLSTEEAKTIKAIEDKYKYKDIIFFREWTLREKESAGKLKRAKPEESTKDSGSKSGPKKVQSKVSFEKAKTKKGTEENTLFDLISGGETFNVFSDVGLQRWELGKSAVVEARRAFKSTFDALPKENLIKMAIRRVSITLYQDSSHKAGAKMSEFAFEHILFRADSNDNDSMYSASVENFVGYDYVSRPGAVTPVVGVTNYDKAGACSIAAHDPTGQKLLEFGIHTVNSKEGDVQMQALMMLQPIFVSAGPVHINRMLKLFCLAESIDIGDIVEGISNSYEEAKKRSKKRAADFLGVSNDVKTGNERKVKFSVVHVDIDICAPVLSVRRTDDEKEDSLNFNMEFGRLRIHRVAKDAELIRGWDTTGLLKLEKQDFYEMYGVTFDCMRAHFWYDSKPGEPQQVLGEINLHVIAQWDLLRQEGAPHLRLLAKIPQVALAVNPTVLTSGLNIAGVYYEAVNEGVAGAFGGTHPQASSPATVAKVKPASKGKRPKSLPPNMKLVETFLRAETISLDTRHAVGERVDVELAAAKLVNVELAILYRSYDVTGALSCEDVLIEDKTLPDEVQSDSQEKVLTRKNSTAAMNARIDMLEKESKIVYSVDRKGKKYFNLEFISVEPNSALYDSVAASFTVKLSFLPLRIVYRRELVYSLMGLYIYINELIRQQRAIRRKYNESMGDIAQKKEKIKAREEQRQQEERIRDALQKKGQGDVGDLSKKKRKRKVLKEELRIEVEVQGIALWMDNGQGDVYSSLKIEDLCGTVWLKDLTTGGSVDIGNLEVVDFHSAVSKYKTIISRTDTNTKFLELTFSSAYTEDSTKILELNVQVRKLTIIIVKRWIMDVIEYFAGGVVLPKVKAALAAANDLSNITMMEDIAKIRPKPALFDISCRIESPLVVIPASSYEADSSALRLNLGVIEISTEQFHRPVKRVAGGRDVFDVAVINSIKLNVVQVQADVLFGNKKCLPLLSDLTCDLFVESVVGELCRDVPNVRVFADIKHLSISITQKHIETVLRIILGNLSESATIDVASLSERYPAVAKVENNVVDSLQRYIDDTKREIVKQKNIKKHRHDLMIYEQDMLNPNVSIEQASKAKQKIQKLKNKIALAGKLANMRKNKGSTPSAPVSPEESVAVIEGISNPSMEYENSVLSGFDGEFTVPQEVLDKEEKKVKKVIRRYGNAGDLLLRLRTQTTLEIDVKMPSFSVELQNYSLNVQPFLAAKGTDVKFLMQFGSDETFRVVFSFGSLMVLDQRSIDRVHFPYILAPATHNTSPADLENRGKPKVPSADMCTLVYGKDDDGSAALSLFLAETHAIVTPDVPLAVVDYLLSIKNVISNETKNRSAKAKSPRPRSSSKSSDKADTSGGPTAVSKLHKAKARTIMPLADITPMYVRFNLEDFRVTMRGDTNAESGLTSRNLTVRFGIQGCVDLRPAHADVLFRVHELEVFATNYAFDLKKAYNIINACNLSVEFLMSPKDSHTLHTRLLLHLDPFDMYVSYQDIRMVMNIMNAFTSQDFKKRLEKLRPDPSVDQASSKERRIQANESTTQAEKFRKAAKAAADEAKTPPAITYLGTFKVFGRGLRAIVLNDCHGRHLPMFDMSIHEFHTWFEARNASTFTTATLAVSVQYFNPGVMVWEPLIEPWAADLTIRSQTSNPYCKVVVESKKTLNINLTSALISNLVQTMKMWYWDLSSGMDPIENSTFSLSNQTGLPIHIIMPDGEVHILGPVQEKEVAGPTTRHERSMHNPQEASVHVTVELQGNGYNPVENISLSIPGIYIHTVVSSNDGSTHNIVCEVIDDGVTRSLRVSSTVVITNETSYNLHTEIQSATKLSGEEENARSSMGMIQSDQSAPIPLCLVGLFSCGDVNVAMRPSPKYNWSKPFGGNTFDNNYVRRASMASIGNEEDEKKMEKRTASTVKSRRVATHILQCERKDQVAGAKPHPPLSFVVLMERCLSGRQWGRKEKGLANLERHVMHIQPPMSVTNGLPCKLEVRVDNFPQSDGGKANGAVTRTSGQYNKAGTTTTIAPGDTGNIHVWNTIDIAAVTIKIPGYEWSTVDESPPLRTMGSKVSENSCVQLRSESDPNRVLNIRLQKVSIRHGGAVGVTVYCPFWILNLSSTPLKYRKSDMGLDTEKRSIHNDGEVFDLPANIRSDVTSKRKVTLFSYAKSSGLLKDQMVVAHQQDDSEWSKAVSIDTVGASKWVQVPGSTKGKKQDRVDLGVQAKFGSGIFTLTKIVTIVPRFLVLNQTSVDIEVRQAGPTDCRPNTIASACSGNITIDYSLQENKSETHIQFRLISPRTAWSGLLPLDDRAMNCTMGIQLGEKKVQGATEASTVFMYAECTSDGPYMTFKIKEADADTPPYLIENSTSFDMHFQQTGSDAVFKVLPGMRMPYAFEEPLVGKQTLDFFFESQGQVVARGTTNPFNVSAKNRIPCSAGNEEPATIYVCEKSTSSSCILNYSFNRAEETQGRTSITSAGNALEFSMKFNGFGVSFVEKNCEELAYIGVQNFSAALNCGESDFSFKLAIERFQVDDTAYDTACPIIFGPRLDRKTDQKPFLAFRAMTSDLSKSVDHVELEFHPVVLNVYEPFILRVMRFVDGLKLFDSSDLSNAVVQKQKEIVANRRRDKDKATKQRPATKKHKNKTPFHFDLILVHKMRVQFSVRMAQVEDLKGVQVWPVIGALKSVMVNIDRANLKFDRLKIEDATLPISELVERLVAFYSMELASQTFNLIGAVDVIKNPMRAFNKSMAKWFKDDKQKDADEEDAKIEEAGIVEVSRMRYPRTFRVNGSFGKYDPFISTGQVNIARYDKDAISDSKMRCVFYAESGDFGLIVTPESVLKLNLQSFTLDKELRSSEVSHAHVKDRHVVVHGASGSVIHFTESDINAAHETATGLNTLIEDNAQLFDKAEASTQ